MRKNAYKGYASYGSYARRMAALSRYIGTRRHLWGENPPARLLGWVDEYDMLRYAYPSKFETYCFELGVGYHNAYDLLA